VKCYNQL